MVFTNSLILREPVDRSWYWRYSLYMADKFIPEVALDYLKGGKRAAIATVVSTWGSAPRGIGSQLAISGDGAFEGSVSGGCVEGAVIIEAQDVIIDGKCKLLEFGVADEDAFAVGLACGGTIKILVEPVDADGCITKADLDNICAAHDSRNFRSYQINLSGFLRSEISANAAQIKLKDDVFTMAYHPRMRMVIIGAVHITKTLSPMAKMAGYDVFLVDPRESFASVDRFPDDKFVGGWSDEALQEIGVDKNTAVVALTHDLKIDIPALEVALKSDAFYIGALGSRKTHAKRIGELEALGFTSKDIARIKSPIGLDIGSKSPAEIAVSIIAEITKELHQTVFGKAT